MHVTDLCCHMCLQILYCTRLSVYLLIVLYALISVPAYQCTVRAYQCTERAEVLKRVVRKGF